MGFHSSFVRRAFLHTNPAFQMRKGSYNTPQHIQLAAQITRANREISITAMRHILPPLLVLMLAILFICCVHFPVIF